MTHPSVNQKSSQQPVVSDLPNT